MIPMPQFGQQAQQFPNAYAAMMQRPPMMGAPPQWQPHPVPIGPAQPVQGPVAAPQQPIMPAWGANPPQMQPMQGQMPQPAINQPPANNLAALSNLRRPVMMPQ